MGTFTKKIKTILASAAAVATLAVSADASQLRFDVLEARWDNVVDGAFVTQLDSTFSSGTRTINWGAGGTSGYDFTPEATPLTANPETAFDLGNFVHRNQPINAGTAITSVDLFLRGQITAIADDLSESVIGTRIFAFNFDHNETTNSPGSGICDFGGPIPCGDVVTVSILDSTEFFEAFGQTWTLNILGFVDPSTDLVSNSFLSAEEANNNRTLRASFTTSLAPVPLPAGLPLMAGAFGIMGWIGRRRKRG